MKKLKNKAERGERITIKNFYGKMNYVINRSLTRE